MRNGRTAAHAARSSTDDGNGVDRGPSASADDSESALDHRLEVCPPSLFSDGDTAPRSRFGTWLPTLGGLRGWLSTGWLQSLTADAPDTLPMHHDGAARATDTAPVQAARLAFASALADLSTPGADDLVRRAAAAVTLRDLWHLRNELFTLVSIAHCERVGHERLGELNRFFPVRAQSSIGRRQWPFPASPRHGRSPGATL